MIRKTKILQGERGDKNKNFSERQMKGISERNGLFKLRLDGIESGYYCDFSESQARKLRFRHCYDPIQYFLNLYYKLILDD